MAKITDKSKHPHDAWREDMEAEEAKETRAQEPWSLANHLRTRIDHCGLSQYEVAKRAGITPQMLYKFMAGKDITLATADKILAVVDPGFAGAATAEEEVLRRIGAVRERRAQDLGQIGADLYFILQKINKMTE